MSMMKIGTLLLVSAVVACVLFVVVAIATPTPEPDAPFDGWQVLGTLLLIYWLGAAVAGAIVVLVNLLNPRRNERSVFGIWPSSKQAVESQPAPADRLGSGVGNPSDLATADRSRTGGSAMGMSARPAPFETTPKPSDRPSPKAGSVRASVFCSKCGTQNRRGQKFCNACESPLPVADTPRRSSRR